MKSFKQYLKETVKTITTKRIFKQIQVSINAKNINKAWKEIYTESNISEFELRSSYDVKNNKFYTWYAIDALHYDIIKEFNINHKAEISFEYNTSIKDLLIKDGYKQLDRSGNEIQNKIERYFGKNVKIQFLHGLPKVWI